MYLVLFIYWHIINKYQKECRVSKLRIWSNKFLKDKNKKCRSRRDKLRYSWKNKVPRPHAWWKTITQLLRKGVPPVWRHTPTWVSVWKGKDQRSEEHQPFWAPALRLSLLLVAFRRTGNRWVRFEGRLVGSLDPPKRCYFQLLVNRPTRSPTSCFAHRYVCRLLFSCLLASGVWFLDWIGLTHRYCTSHII